MTRKDTSPCHIMVKMSRVQKKGMILKTEGRNVKSGVKVNPRAAAVCLA